MKRYLMIFAVLALLALPLAAGAQSTEGMNCRSWDDTGCMPSWWTPTPPASKAADTARLRELLAKKGVITLPSEAVESARLTELLVKGVITPQEATQLAQP